MGFRVTYYQSSYQKLKAYINDEETSDEQEDGERRECDVDKSWDVLHFVLMGKSATYPIQGDCLSEAIVGQHTIFGEPDDIYVAGTYSGHVCEIAKALQEVDFGKCPEKFALRDFYREMVEKGCAMIMSRS